MKTQLKPFNLDAAKRGEPIVTRYGTKARFLAHAPELTSGGRVLVSVEGSSCAEALHEDGIYTHGTEHHLDIFMAPLCWVEGLPVYVGDRLWHATHVWTTAAGPSEDVHKGFIDTDGDLITVYNVTWTKPILKKKVWANVYPCNTHDSRAEADQQASTRRVACVELEIEVKEEHHA